MANGMIPGGGAGAWDVAPANYLGMAGGGGGGFGESVGSLFQDRNFLNLLAGIGSRVGGPGSVGEAIGVPTQGMIQGKAMQEALAGSEASRKSQMDQLIKILAGLSPGDMTPKEEAGPTALKTSPGGYTLDITSPIKEENVGTPTSTAFPAGASSRSQQVGQPFKAPGSPKAASPGGGGYNLSDIIPFY